MLEIWRIIVLKKAREKEEEKKEYAYLFLSLVCCKKKGQWSCIHQQHKCYEFRVKNLHYAAVMRTS